MKLTILSPAPPVTRLHEINVAFGDLLATSGLDVEVIPLALPDSINLSRDLPDRERALRLPIVTVADLLPAIEHTGPHWHAYARPSPDLKLVASLYDVAFGISVTSAAIETPGDLAAQAVYAPPRPSSVRLMTEALLEAGWDLGGKVGIVDSTPLDLGPAIGRGALKATSWNITTLEGGTTTPNLRLRGGRFLPVDDDTLARLNAGLHFRLDTCDLDGTQLLAFRQGIAVWDDTPPDVAAAILDVLTGRAGGPFFSQPADLAGWPGLDDTHRHPALMKLLQSGDFG